MLLIYNSRKRTIRWFNASNPWGKALQIRNFMFWAKGLIFLERDGILNSIFILWWFIHASQRTKGAGFDDGYFWGGFRLKQNIGRGNIFQGVNTPFVAVPLWVTFREYCRLLWGIRTGMPVFILTLALSVTNRSLQPSMAACCGIFMSFSVNPNL